jgi:osmotically-inducible protein OsmY
MLYHYSTSTLNPKVVTKRGMVTLSDKAASSAELDLATKLARDVKV